MASSETCCCERADSDRAGLSRHYCPVGTRTLCEECAIVGQGTCPTHKAPVSVSFFRGEHTHIPKKTVRVVADDDRHQSWSWGTIHHPGDTVRIMAVHGSFHLTAFDPNLDVRIMRTHLVLRYWDRWRFRQVTGGGQALVSDGRGPSGFWSGHTTIPRGHTREVHGEWVIEPAFRAESDTRPLRARTYFVDQLDNAHTTQGKVSFRFSP